MFISSFDNHSVDWRMDIPDVEIFSRASETEGTEGLMPGWYYRLRLPGSPPDGDPIGPFRGISDAISAARGLKSDDWWEDNYETPEPAPEPFYWEDPCSLL
jgi:hypothetical protein